MQKMFPHKYYKAVVEKGDYVESRLMKYEMAIKELPSKFRELAKESLRIIFEYRWSKINNKI